MGLAIVLTMVTAAPGQESDPAMEPEHIVVGAIRWDAWTGGEVTAQVERTLGPRQYQHRLPWFAKVTGDDTATIDGSPQSVMDREIAWAAAAGLDYWAFLIYPEDSSMSVALGQYLRSTQRQQLRFCVILHGTLGVDDKAWPRERDRLVGLMRHERYQTVLAGRPLVYCFNERLPPERFQELRAARQAGLNPYFVWMGWRLATDYQAVSPNGFDAVSAYAIASADQWGEFRQLCAAAEARYWQEPAAAGVPIVPLVTSGWDKRPRKEHPVSWEKDHSYHRETTFPAMATPAEIGAHLGRALEFVRANPKTCPSRAVIIYAWNEYDEGGWLAPTRRSDGSPDTARLDAVAPLLRPARANP